MKRTHLFLAISFVFISLVCVGCSEKDDTIATISPNTDSEYMHTFKDLNLGVLFDFDVRLLQVDKSWVTVWIEGYHDGEKVKPRLAELSFGLSPKKEEKGQLGFAILNRNKKGISTLMYGPGGVSSQSDKIDKDILVSSGLSKWDYAIGDEEVKLESGETKILVVYRQADALKTYDPQDEKAIKRMIEEDKTVLLLKIKVEERTE